MKINRIIALLLAALCLLSAGITVFADESQAESTTPDPVTDNNLVIKNLDTGKNLIIQSGKAKVYQAGVAAKLMTVLVAYEILKDAEAMFSIPLCVADADMKVASDYYLAFKYSETAKSLSLADLVTAATVSSAADACIALAVGAMRYKAGEVTDYYGNYDGAVSAALKERAHINDFVALMNARAAELGCESTLFTNCTGIGDGTSRTTAEDIALIAAALYNYPELVELSDKPSYTLSTGSNQIYNKNALKSAHDNPTGYTSLENTKGMIVGWMQPRRFCVVTAGEKNGLTYIFVSISENVPDTGDATAAKVSAYDTVKQFLPWALDSFKYLEVVSPLQAVRSIHVKSGKNSDSVTIVASKSIELLVTRDLVPEQDIRVEYSYTQQGDLTAPVTKGQKVGEVTVYLYGDEVDKADLITTAAVSESAALSMLDRTKSFLGSAFMMKVYGIALSLFVGYLAIALLLFVYRLVRKYIAAGKE